MGLKEVISQNKQFAIYGCGEYGQLTYRIIRDAGAEIVSFVVSNKNEVEKYRQREKKVMSIMDWEQTDESKNCLIIVAVSEKYTGEIVNELKQREMGNYYVVKNSDFWEPTIGVLDTTISDQNQGNAIIMEAVYKQILPRFTDHYLFKFPYWDDFGKHTIENMKYCKYLFLGGTNALNSEMDTEKWFGVNVENAERIGNKLILMGVGWWKYESAPNQFTKNLLRRVLHKDYLHSVRDSYTEEQLKNAGIMNVINTGCPTIWGLSKEHCEQIPKVKSKDALIMFATTNREQDSKIVDVVMKNYENIYYWVQSPEDGMYIKSICSRAVAILPTLNALEDFLVSHKDIDYIGTRLHGGIKCLQHKKRAIIIAIDNRAREMKKDFNLPVVLQEDIGNLNEIINSSWEVNVNLPHDNIKKWLMQFEV